MTGGVLLLGANYYGTLAAVRAFGRQGIPVTVADESPRARARFSRYATATVVHPPLANTDRLMAWLLEWGTAHPGTVLYPTNDHLAWLFAEHRARLSTAFLMHSPSEEAVITLLDKARLHEACSHPDVAIDVPATATLDVPGSEAAATTHLRFPLLLKPRTQVLLGSGIKGVMVADREALDTGLARFRSLVSFNRALTDRHPEVTAPMVQEYLPAAETAIISVSGYVDEHGHIVARAAQKVLQRPRKLGIGLCFEGRLVDHGLEAKLAALCRRVGYFGTFEAEFIADGDRRLLIDFNPRFYSQMAFDLDRGLALPLMVWHAARGESQELEAELERARTWEPTGHEIYCHKAMLDLVLGTQRLSGRMSAAEVQRWRSWYAQRRTTATDAVRDIEDRWPVVADTLEWIWSFARHPRSFVRSFVLNDA